LRREHREKQAAPPVQVRREAKALHRTINLMSAPAIAVSPNSVLARPCASRRWRWRRLPLGEEYTRRFICCVSLNGLTILEFLRLNDDPSTAEHPFSDPDGDAFEARDRIPHLLSQLNLWLCCHLGIPFLFHRREEAQQ